MGPFAFQGRYATGIEAITPVRIETRSWTERAGAAVRIGLWRMSRVHPERYCHRCGGRNVSWSAPSPLWNAVMRGGSINGDWLWHEIICPACFAVLAELQGIAQRWRLKADYVHVELETITPSGRVWDETAQMWVQTVDAA